MAVEEIAEVLVETALTFAPWLEDIPVLGRILRLFAPLGGNDVRAMDALESQIQKSKAQHEDTIKKNARYVIKASDAMKCVDSTLGNSGVLLAIGKAIVNAVAGRGAVTGPDILEDKIFACIESKVLKQTSKRVKTEAKYYARPSKGHGHGRESF